MRKWLLLIFAVIVPCGWAQVAGTATQLTSDPASCTGTTATPQVWYNTSTNSLKSCQLVNGTNQVVVIASAGELGGAIEASNYKTSSSDWCQDILAAINAASANGTNLVTYFYPPTSYTCSATDANNMFGSVPSTGIKVILGSPETRLDHRRWQNRNSATGATAAAAAAAGRGTCVAGTSRTVPKAYSWCCGIAASFIGH